MKQEAYQLCIHTQMMNKSAMMKDYRLESLLASRSTEKNDFTMIPAIMTDWWSRLDGSFEIMA